jgi:hypothetical protein
VQSASSARRWEDGANVVDFDPMTGKDETSYPQVRWLPALQNDFAARADWCTKVYYKANHAPEVRLTHSNDIAAKPGSRIWLIGAASDPDGDILAYSWWQYKEAGSYNKSIPIQGNHSKKASVVIPIDSKQGETIHFIFEVKDSGTPSLTRYQRIILTVK